MNKNVVKALICFLLYSVPELTCREANQYEREVDYITLTERQVKQVNIYELC